MISKKFQKRKRADMDFVDEVNERIRQIQSQMQENFFYKITSEMEFEELNLLKELQKMRDKLTNVLFCNPNDYDLLKESLDKQPGFWELIKMPAVEKGKVVFVEDGKTKIEILQRKRFKKEIGNSNDKD